MVGLYITDVYISHESTFPPELWADIPDLSKRTNNGPESFHAHFNGQFYSKQPSIYLFLDVILKLQTVTYIRMRNMNENAPRSRKDREKEVYLLELLRKYQTNTITRSAYIKSVAYKHLPNTVL